MLGLSGRIGEYYADIIKGASEDKGEVIYDEHEF